MTFDGSADIETFQLPAKLKYIEYYLNTAFEFSVL